MSKIYNKVRRNEIEDKEILGLYWNRSENAITETRNKYGRYLRGIAARILRNNEDAEECESDTYMKAWDRLPPDKPDILSAFLGKITRNLSLDLYEKKNTQKRGGGEIPLILEELEECLSSQDNPLTKEQVIELINLVQ